MTSMSHVAPWGIITDVGQSPYGDRDGNEYKPEREIGSDFFLNNFGG